jgi:beta-lactam-binding protein with PASTA domain
MSLKNFIFSKAFFRNLGLAVVIVVVTVMLALVWMNFYTRHGQARAVPDFYGLTVDQAKNLAKAKKLRFQIIDSVYTNVVPKGCVAEQNPKPGFKVKKWRNIAVTINAFQPEMVAMPDLIDLPLRQASKVLENVGLEMGQRRFKPDLAVNVVIEQLYRGRYISRGDFIQKGSVIDLVLGKGLSNERTNVPYLLGMTLDPALNRIMESSLNLGTYIYDNTVLSGSDSVNAVVFKQNPEYRPASTLPIGSDIYLWLTTDPSKINTDSATNYTDTIPSEELVTSTP